MPKRLIDGEKLWGSDKLRQVEPEEFRAEYSNLLPLALADGSFECDPHRIWSLVYAYNRSRITVEKVQEILNEFERVKLLFRWVAEDKKQWGYWVGIEKDGLLPSDSHKIRYKKGKTPPLEQLNLFTNNNIEQHPDELRTSSGPYPAGFGLVSNRLALGLEGEKDSDMSFKTNIADKSLEILGVRVFPEDRGWDGLNSYKRVRGPAETLQAFEEWAKDHQGEEIRYPLTEFLRVADRHFETKFVTKTNADPLISELALMSDGDVTFKQKQTIEIARLLEKYSDVDIKAAFREFLEKIDDRSLPFAAKDFCETAGQLIEVQKSRKEKSAQIEKQLEEVMTREREKSEAELAKIPEYREIEL